MVSGKRRPKRKPGRRAPKKAPAQAGADISNALTINYPLHFFDTNLDPRDWREQRAFYSADLVRKGETSREWTEWARAQDQEDIWLYENWFYGVKHGVIIESGALDGDLFSTSSLFENYANWTSIHVEADPYNYHKLTQNRPRGINVHGALCSESRLLHYSSEGVQPVRGFIEFMTPSFMKQWHGRVYNNKTRVEDLPTVQCLPMRFLLRELNVKWVDLWILDVEGAEESVLLVGSVSLSCVPYRVCGKCVAVMCHLSCVWVVCRCHVSLIVRAFC